MARRDTKIRRCLHDVDSFWTQSEVALRRASATSSSCGPGRDGWLRTANPTLGSARRRWLRARRSLNFWHAHDRHPRAAPRTRAPAARLLSSLRSLEGAEPRRHVATVARPGLRTGRGAVHGVRADGNPEGEEASCARRRARSSDRRKPGDRIVGGCGPVARRAWRRPAPCAAGANS